MKTPKIIYVQLQKHFDTSTENIVFKVPKSGLNSQQPPTVYIFLPQEMFT